MKKIKVDICFFMTGITIFVGIIFVVLCGIRIARAISFQKNCENYINHAENAPNAEVAAEQLEIAILEMERLGLIEGDPMFICPEKNSIGYSYNTLVEFKEGFEAFDVDVDSEVYNVELNAMQTRLQNNSLPFMISLRSKGLSLTYALSWIVFIVCACMLVYVESKYDHWRYKFQPLWEVTLYIPSFSKKVETTVEE